MATLASAKEKRLPRVFAQFAANKFVDLAARRRREAAADARQCSVSGSIVALRLPIRPAASRKEARLFSGASRKSRFQQAFAQAFQASLPNKSDRAHRDARAPRQFLDRAERARQRRACAPTAGSAAAIPPWLAADSVLLPPAAEFPSASDGVLRSSTSSFGSESSTRCCCCFR